MFGDGFNVKDPHAQQQTLLSNGQFSTCLNLKGVSTQCHILTALAVRLWKGANGRPKYDGRHRYVMATFLTITRGVTIMITVTTY